MTTTEYEILVKLLNQYYFVTSSDDVERAIDVIEREILEMRL